MAIKPKGKSKPNNKTNSRQANLPATRDSHLLPWQSQVVTRLSEDHPSIEVLDDWLEMVLGELELTVTPREASRWLRSDGANFVRAYCRRTQKGLHAQAMEVASLAKLTRTAPLRVIREGMNADKVIVGPDGSVVTTPDHKLRLVAAKMAIDVFGMEAPAKVEVNPGQEMKELSEADLKVRTAEVLARLAELQQNINAKNQTQDTPEAKIIEAEVVN